MDDLIKIKEAKEKHEPEVDSESNEDKYSNNKVELMKMKWVKP